MYRITILETGEELAKVEMIDFVKWSDNLGTHIGCETFEEADGVLLNGTAYGIGGRNMQTYTPLIWVEEVLENTVKIEFMSGVLNDVVAQVNTINEKVNTIYDAQTQGVVLQSELDAAYKEGVNSYAE